MGLCPFHLLIKNFPARANLLLQCQRLPTSFIIHASPLLVAASLTFTVFKFQAWWEVDKIPPTTYLLFLSCPLCQPFYLQAHVLALLPPLKLSKIFFFQPFCFCWGFKHSPLSISPTPETICMGKPSCFGFLPDAIERVPEKRQGDCYQILRVLRY